MTLTIHLTLRGKPRAVRRLATIVRMFIGTVISAKFVRSVSASLEQTVGKERPRWAATGDKR